MPVEPNVDVPALRSRLAEQAAQVHAELAELVAIPSVSAAAFDRAHVEASAAAVADLLRGAGMPQVDVLRVAGGAPAVVAHRPGATGAPRVLLYAHHDVQPPGDPAAWHSEPFVATERGGRLYGRGAADDKAGIMVHLAAIRALGAESAEAADAGNTGVSLTIFVEGEEEIGSPTFEAFLAEYREQLAADVIIVADSGNWRIGEPALTTSLRGLVDGVIEVRTLDHALHSGMFGGAVPDALMALIRVLDTLWDGAGEVAVPGLVRSEAAELPYSDDDLRADSGLLDGVQPVGSGSVLSRLWTRPAVSVIGIDAPSVATASNTLHPVARAKFSLRLAPGQSPAAAFEALRTHVQAHAPWGAHVAVTLGEAGEAWAGALDGPVYDLARWALDQAWGRPAVHMGVGGSIPFIAALQRAYPESVVLVTGVEDPDTRAHGADESLHLAEFERACLAEALLLAALGQS